MFKKVLLTLSAAIIVFFGIVAMQPNEFRVVRSTTIRATPAVVFGHVNQLHQWEAWSPWAKLDPNMQATYEGPSAGVGAIHRWSGNDDVGAGSMTITESRPDELVRFKLEFLKPFVGTNDTEFRFEGVGDGTVVTWTMTGQSAFVCKAIGLFISMDKMIGGQFEQGLAQMKTIAEAEEKE